MLKNRNILLWTMLAAALWSCAARANTFTVTDAGDSGPGTLRDAISQANSNPGKDTIVFDLPRAGDGTFAEIGLDSGRLTITDSVDINNSSAQNVTVRRVGTTEHGIFLVESMAPITVRMNGLNVFDGASTVGGGINVSFPSDTKVELTNMYFKGNRATQGSSGAGAREAPFTTAGRPR